MAHLEYLRDVSLPVRPRPAPRPRGVPARLRQARRRAGPAVEGRPLRRPELAGRPATGGLEGPEGPGPDGPQGAPTRRPSATGSTPTPRSKAAYGAAWDKIAAAQKVAGRDRPAAQLPRARARLRLAPLPDRPRPSSGSPRRRPSRTPTGSASTATRPSSRSSSSSSPTPRSIPSSRRPSSPTRSPSGRRRWAPTTRSSSASSAAGRPSRPPTTLVDGTKLADVAVRKALAEGGPTAIEASDDPMIKLALAVDADARALRKRFEDEVEGVQTAQYALIAKARLRAEGRLDLSRRDLHPPARLRDGQGLRGRRQDDPRLHHDRRRLRARRRRTATRPPTSCRRAGSRPRTSAGSGSTRRSTSSRRPTSSAATRGARSSTATTRSSA